MSPLFIPLLFLSLLPSESVPADAKPDPHADFFRSCPPVPCGSGSNSLSIRFPLRLRSSPSSCGLPGLELTCSADNHPLLSLPSLPPLRVTDIDYQHSSLTVLIGSGPGSLPDPCPIRNLTSLKLLTTDIYSPYTINASLFSCPYRFAPGPDSGSMTGPVPCLSGPGYFVYVVNAEESMEVIPDGCMVVQGGLEMPGPIYFGQYDYGYYYQSNEVAFREAVESFEARREVNLRWDLGEVGTVCESCENLCGYDLELKQSFCQGSSNHGFKVKIIAGTSVGGFVVIFTTVLLVFFYISRQSEKEKETRRKVERFLATYKTTKPARFTFSDIKRITKRFRHKLGQGGFGSVYKGQLPNGVPVAVKMLERSKGEAEEFINEVATMGRIHHVNVVRLLGFCSEGTRHALVYEFMPNGSLEKFIFSEEARCDPSFSMEKLQDIAIGIARGIEYLHQGCDQRILHFDIKPHNILLDHNFNPKISDFGLAKLCARDHSIVTMTAARGTMGYIAPEIYSRNFGTVSSKSDVYSFGMLLLEMVSGKRNVDPEIENHSEAYFPEEVYGRLVNGEDLGLATENGNDADIVKKLVMVALWCIQWSPTDRPTMSRVVQLLVGNLESLQIPPKPFVSTSDQDDDTSVNVVVDSAYLSGSAAV